MCSDQIQVIGRSITQYLSFPEIISKINLYTAGKWGGRGGVVSGDNGISLNLKIIRTRAEHIGQRECSIQRSL